MNAREPRTHHFTDVSFVPRPIVIPPPDDGGARPLTEARSTLIGASLTSLARRGLLSRYFERLPSSLHADVRGLVAGMWTPLPLVMAHYQACDALALPAAVILKIGSEVGRALRATFLGSIAGLTREAGASPWDYLSRGDRLFRRIFRGGAVAIYELGPKQARAEVYGIPLFSIPYFRTGFRGLNQSCAEHCAVKLHISEAPPLGGGEHAFRFSWT